MESIKYINRDSKNICEEKIPGEKCLRYLYYTSSGRMLLKTMVNKKIVSDLYGFLMKMPFSKKKIDAFIAEYKIDIDLFEKPGKGYKNFNDFFIRRIKQSKLNLDINDEVLISPADGKVLVFENLQDETFIIKGMEFNIKTLLQDEQSYHKYKSGSMAIIRLAPADYHRFHFPCDSIPGETKLIKGKYYSVSPLALKQLPNVFLQNKRTVCYLDKTVFGKIAYLEIGATMVGSIKQTYYNPKKAYNPELVFKGQEKGYFEFGGSTVILLFEKDKLKFDNDLLENTSKGLETSIKFGDSLGRLFDETNR